MKRTVAILLSLLLILSCAPALAEGATILCDGLPAEVKQFFSTSTFNGFTIGQEAAAELENTLGGSYLFAVAQKGSHSVLYGFEKKNGRYQYWLRTDNCLPQRAGSFRLRHENGYLYLLNGSPLTLGDSLSILFTRAEYEEQGDTELFFQVNPNGQFQLLLLSYDYLWSEALFSDDSIAYYQDGDYLGAAYGTVERNLRYFNLSAFPRTLKDAREKLTNPPSIPSGQLTARRIKFTGGQSFPVYSGPGMEYERAASGKALVSTNDWIQVFGTENGYILIQYAISSSQMRFGYIDQSALPSGQTVSPLSFSWEAASLLSNTYLTDDPLNSQSRVRSLAAGESVKWLASMGSWVYIEVAGLGQPIRGFVPASAIQKGTPQKEYTASFGNETYSAAAFVRLLNGVTLNASVSVFYPAAWKESGADMIIGYQVYANQLPVIADVSVRQDASNAWMKTFELSATLPAGASVIGLCPVYSLSGQHAEETMILMVEQ